jgi:hypothetical protein
MQPFQQFVSLFNRINFMQIAVTLQDYNYMKY